MSIDWRRKLEAGRRLVIVGAAGLVLATTTHVDPAEAAVTKVTGGAFGWTTAVSLFGGPTVTYGLGAADAVVDLPASGGGSTVPMVDAAATGTGRYGPATIYQSGPAVVSTHGDKGNAIHAGFVASSATVADIGFWHGVMLEDTTGAWDPAVGGEMDPFIAAAVTSTCRVDEDGTIEGGATIVGGRVVDTDANGDPTNVRQVDVNPAPNTVMTGVLAHVGDDWKVTFNEQVVVSGPTEKSIEVNAVHLELLGPIAVGHMYIGQSRCRYEP